MIELWDILDENRRLTGRTHKRGKPLPDGDFHLVVRAWIANKKGEFLIARRCLSKQGWSGMWEIPSGSVTTSEKSLDAIIRETREETGIILFPENAELLSSYRLDQFKSFYDNWLFRQEFDLTDVVLQEGETIDARAATWSEINSMMKRDEFIERDVFIEFDLLKNIKF